MTNSADFRWGILGLGNIAAQFARGLRELEGARVAAVASRSQQKADGFGAEFGAERCHGSYEAIAEDVDLDAVYIATPHTLHRENAVMCLEAGKAVLCEKPFTINAAEAGEVVELARRRKLLCMEAMWSRFLPVMARLRELVQEGVIGEVRMLYADFSFEAEFDPRSRLFDPNLGGGALLDVGIYPISLASMLFGEPASISGAAHLCETSVDEQSGFVLAYKGGQIALISAGSRLQGFREAHIVGTKGRIRIEAPWFIPRAMVISRANQPDERIELNPRGNGYCHEAEEFMRCYREGLTECSSMPLSETLANMQVMDTLRSQWGVVYPIERENDSRPNPGQGYG